MKREKIAELALIGVCVGAIGTMAACKPQPVTGPANVYVTDKADAGVSDPNAVGADNRVNPDSVDSSTGYSDRTNTAQRP